MAVQQKPLELILARNLLSSISTPAFLVGPEGVLLFYNEAAGALVGRRFEESGSMSASQWTSEFGPFRADGEPMGYDEIPLTQAIREGRPAHFTFCIRTSGGTMREIAASGIPIIGQGGSSGAIVIFWPVGGNQADDGEEEG
jgi:PAS domain-containing protein